MKTKIKTALVSLFLLSPLVTGQAVMAHGPAKEKTQAEKEISSKTTVAEDLKSLQDVMAKIKTALQAKNFKDIHDLIDQSSSLIKALGTKATPPSEKKQRLASALKQLTNQIDKLHHAVDDEDQAKSEAEFKKAEGAMKLVEVNLN